MVNLPSKCFIPLVASTRLSDHGFELHDFPIPEFVRAWVKERKWEDVDQYFKKTTAPDGDLFHYLQRFHPFSQIETMLSIRDSRNEWEEDGIWHDDGSRVLAFSLSLTISPDEIMGGRLGIRKVGTVKAEMVSTPRFGAAIVFLTGVHGYEHCIFKVEKGERVILVGWCLA